MPVARLTPERCFCSKFKVFPRGGRDLLRRDFPEHLRIALREFVAQPRELVEGQAFRPRRVLLDVQVVARERLRDDAGEIGLRDSFAGHERHVLQNAGRRHGEVGGRHAHLVLRRHLAEPVRHVEPGAVRDALLVDVLEEEAVSDQIHREPQRHVVRVAHGAGGPSGVVRDLLLILVHENDATLLRRRVALRFHEDRLPRTQPREGTPRGLERGRRVEVPHDRDHEVLPREHGLVDAAQVGEPDPVQGRRVSRHGIPVGRMRVQRFSIRDVRVVEGAIAEALRALDQVLANLRDLARRERGLGHDVAEDVPGLREVPGRSLPGHFREIRRTVRAERHSQSVGPLRNLAGAHGARAAAEERGRHVGNACQALGLDPLAAARERGDRDDRRGMIFL